MNYKKSYKLLHIGMWVGIIIGFGGVSAGNTTVANIGILILALSYVQAFFFYECPHCEERLSTTRRMPKCCPKCGERL